MRFWLRWAVGVAAMIGIVVVWAFDSGSCASVGDGPDAYTEACDLGAISGSATTIVLTLLLAAAAMWAIFTTKRDAER